MSHRTIIIASNYSTIYVVSNEWACSGPPPPPETNPDPNDKRLNWGSNWGKTNSATQSIQLYGRAAKFRGGATVAFGQSLWGCAADDTIGPTTFMTPMLLQWRPIPIAVVCLSVCLQCAVGLSGAIYSCNNCVQQNTKARLTDW